MKAPMVVISKRCVKRIEEVIAMLHSHVQTNQDISKKQQQEQEDGKEFQPRPNLPDYGVVGDQEKTEKQDHIKQSNEFEI